MKYYAVEIKHINHSNKPEYEDYPLKTPYIFHIYDDEDIVEHLHQCIIDSNDGIDGQIVITDIRRATDEEIASYLNGDEI